MSDATGYVDVNRMIEGAQDAITVKRVFGSPYETEGATLVPVAAVGGGGGGGGGEGQEEGKSGGGAGGGFGLKARPVGVYVLKDGQVRWQPVIDVNRIAVGGFLLGALGLLTWLSVEKARIAGRPRGIRRRGRAPRAVGFRRRRAT